MAELRVPALADDVVRLRRWREIDVPAQLEAFSDPEFERFSDWAPHTEAEARAYLAELEQARRAAQQIEFALVEPHDDNVVLCGPDNRASQRVGERCGFTREGVLRSHIPFKGMRRDTVVFSLLPGELR